MSRVTVPILVNTNPYSLGKRKYGEVSGSGHAEYTSSIRISIFLESIFFRGTEYPISGHVIETQRVRTSKRPYFSRFAENHGVPLMNARALAFRWLYYPPTYHELLSHFIFPPDLDITACICSACRIALTSSKYQKCLIKVPKRLLMY